MSGEAAVEGSVAEEGFPRRSHLSKSLQEVGSERGTWRRAAWQTSEGASGALAGRRAARPEQGKPRKNWKEMRSEVTGARSCRVLWVIIRTWVFAEK